MIRGDRIRQRLESLERSQSNLARAIGVSPQAVNKMVKGDTTDTAKLYQIARELQTTPEYLTGESNDPSGLASDGSLAPTVMDLAADQGLIPIRQLDLSFGMGATYIDNPVDEEIRLFPEIWLRQFTNAPAQFIYFAQGSGDSMQPTLHPNDTLIIDASNRRMTMADQIWACNFAGLGMVKRLRPTPDGGVKIMSDNPNVPEEVAYDGELSLFGRVVAVVRKI